MAARLFLLNLVLTTFLGAQATIYVTNPVSGGSYSGGQTITVTWLDNGEAPLLENIGSCNVALYMDDETLVQQIAQVDVAQTNSLTFTPNTVAGPNSDDYYVQFTSVNPVNGATLVEYSPDFTLTGMSGSSGSQVPSLTSAVPTVIASSVSASGVTSAASSDSTSGVAVPTSAQSSISSAASSGASSISSGASSLASSVSRVSASIASSESSVAASASSAGSSALSSLSSRASSASSLLSSGFSSVRSSASSAGASAASQISNAALSQHGFSIPMSALGIAALGVIAGAAIL